MPSHSNNQSPILSVSELNQFARGTLEMHVGQVWVSGEISNFSAPASGHWYFTLKDDNAQISCAMFRGKNQFIRTRLKTGMQVLVNGKVSLYEGRGSYQLIADYIEESGVGAMARTFEALKAKLLKEGLFNQSHKKILPKQLQHIAVVTSDTGAAIHDILSVLKERFPSLKVSLVPAQVQGDAAPRSLINALDQVQRFHQQSAIDAVIIGRGGGSAEDLWAFNNEQLARAVFNFDLPIISAVGHEVDTTICDLVADVRAPTPSAAAEMISPDQEQLRQTIDYLAQRLLQAIENSQQSALQRLKLEQSKLQHPSKTIALYKQRFTSVEQQIRFSLIQSIQQSKQQLEQLEGRLERQEPQQKLNQYNQLVNQQSHVLSQLIKQRIEQSKQSLAKISGQLEIVSPLATLSRGYSIIKDENQQIIRKAGQLKENQIIEAQLHQGNIKAKVIKTS